MRKTLSKKQEPADQSSPVFTRKEDGKGLSMTATYKEFLARKRITAPVAGFDPGPLHRRAFPHQRDIVRWACRRGRAALFEDCGLMKTGQEVMWAEQVHLKTSAPVLILAPWMVAEQTVDEGKNLWGVDINLCRSDADVKPGINITNYEKLHKFEPDFAGIVADESGILKAYDGKTRNQVIGFSRNIPYRLAGTATPSPNSHEELGNHAEFLGIMSMAEMLATFFVHDGGDTSKWRLKGHAEVAFREWLSTWAVFLTKPSDLGYSDEGFELPPHEIILHVLDCGPSEGFLFPVEARTLSERRGARRSGIDQKVQEIAALVNSSEDQWIVWCGLNDESSALAKAIPTAVEITGKTAATDKNDESRKSLMRRFMAWEKKDLISKGSICGWGMNLQFSRNAALCSMSDSAEEMYQILRRQLRFGQKRKVNFHVFLSTAEMAVWRNVERKQRETDKLTRAMVDHMKDFNQREIRGVTRETIAYSPTKPLELPEWLNG
jgi:hypothetical protein